uniref:VDE lipocalin domain-containing protein n=1 Tax=Chromera velia CCMP2878 TaxID=1169474 RepID=A0A0G4GN37_9ALVE|eukprot:Cvel_22627.t1-p1 / transcript=Cvel_22627.t1 / gene=Cvel_22627 / organism=Chromera_velia_CCMP2878 / gene_product=Violaxanthin de-epoxidase, chloroplastic, putative / transcript_product=Violaxanthin de-epoxidase, chloroplastic, putative / location=Cvel_scaffold2242:26262-29075(-) / protein_length=736 / sequence_SO=supercontig / SO=protein_coding / is_pseudo=false
MAKRRRGLGFIGQSAGRRPSSRRVDATGAITSSAVPRVVDLFEVDAGPLSSLRAEIQESLPVGRGEGVSALETGDGEEREREEEGPWSAAVDGLRALSKGLSLVPLVLLSTAAALLLPSPDFLLSVAPSLSLADMGVEENYRARDFIPAAYADDELTKYAETNPVTVDPLCFLNKCYDTTKACMGDRSCTKGLTCLARCRGEGMCSTGCFARFGSPVLDDFLQCSLEKASCVNVPKDLGQPTWDPPEIGAPPVSYEAFNMDSMEGTWYKVLGLDSRYDCFQCQRNDFARNPKNPDKWDVDVTFVLPRKRGGGWQNIVREMAIPEIPTGGLQAGSPSVSSAVPQMNLLKGPFSPLPAHAAGETSIGKRSYRTTGSMFGLTFWENWYIVGDSQDPRWRWKLEGSDLPENQWKFVYYTGHTLQGNYKGAFVYMRTPEYDGRMTPTLKKVAEEAGLDLSKFCYIKNACFSSAAKNGQTPQGKPGQQQSSPFGGLLSPTFPMLSQQRVQVASSAGGVGVDSDSPTCVAKDASGRGMCASAVGSAAGGPSSSRSAGVGLLSSSSSSSVAGRAEEKRGTSASPGYDFTNIQFPLVSPFETLWNVLFRPGIERSISVAAQAAAAAESQVGGALPSLSGSMGVSVSPEEPAERWGLREFIRQELSDWLDDPATSAEWLLGQQTLLKPERGNMGGQGGLTPSSPQTVPSVSPAQAAGVGVGGGNGYEPMGVGDSSQLLGALKKGKW